MENEIILNEEQQKMKQCTKCGLEKPATTEFFLVDSRKKDGGLRARCRECLREDNAKRWLDPKFCEKELAYQAKRRLDPSVREYYRIYVAKCRFDPEYCEKEHAYDAKRRLDPEYIEYHRAYEVARWLDPEYRERKSAYQSERQKTDRGKVACCVAKQKRRARKSILPDLFTAEEWQQCLLYWNNTCAYCGSSDRLAMDHFIPLASRIELCLGTVKENIVPACKHCNSSKRNKSPYVWATQEALDRIEAYFTSMVLHKGV